MKTRPLPEAAKMGKHENAVHEDVVYDAEEHEMYSSYAYVSSYGDVGALMISVKGTGGVGVHAMAEGNEKMQFVTSMTMRQIRTFCLNVLHLTENNYEHTDADEEIRK